LEYNSNIVLKIIYDYYRLLTPCYYHRALFNQSINHSPATVRQLNDVELLIVNQSPPCRSMHLAATNIELF